MKTETVGINQNIVSPPKKSDITVDRLKKRLSRLRRQRKHLIGDSWRALREGLEAVSNAPASTSNDCPATPQPFALLSQLAEQAEELQSRLQEESSRAQELVAERDQAIASWKSELEERQCLALTLEEMRALSDELHQQLATVQAERSLLQESLAERTALPTPDHSEEMELLKAEIEHRDEQISFLANEVDILRQSAPKDEESVSMELVSELRTQLLDARKEAVELRMQTNELADQIAKHQLQESKGSNESLSWEERKKLLLKELESDDQGASLGDRATIQGIVETTQKEIERRDEEIRELRKLLQEQSSARDGLAVGAAAIAQLLETDELIQTERQKLKGLQSEWEEKVRQAEIELSRERAKLARERQEMDEWLRTLPKQGDATDPAKQNIKAAGGNWLSRLGLKDNS